MLKRFKERVNDWMFEEVEIDEQVEEQPNTNRYINDQLEAKMKYKYPKHHLQNDVINKKNRHKQTNQNIQPKRHPEAQIRSSYMMRQMDDGEKMKKVQEVPTFIRRQRYSD